MKPTDDPLEARRRSVVAEEASALRAEVVRWVRDGEAGEAAADVVRELVRDGLAEQVELALNSRDLGRQLGEELRRRLAERFADDLRDAVAAEVRQALAEGVLGDAGLERLRDEMRAEVRAALAGRKSHRQTGPSGGFAPCGPDPRWWLGGAAAIFAVALGLFAGTWWMARGPAGGEAGPPAAGAAAVDATAAVAEAAEAGKAAAAGAADDDALWSAWRRVAATPPAGLAVERDDLACWFPAPTRAALDALAAEARGNGTNVESRLRTSFGTCVAAYAPAGGAGVAVFAAQAAARRALARHAGGGWAGCAARPEPAPDPTAFVVDGQGGPRTQLLLNGYLACRGLDAAVSFDNGSNATDYLFAVYLALTDPVLT